MSKQLFFPLLVTIVGLSAVAVLVVARPQPEAAPQASEPQGVKIEAIHARKHTVQISVRAQGAVEPKREIELIAQVSGQVVAVEPEFVSGGFFGKDQALIKIDDREYRSALLDAKATVARAQQLLAEEEGLSRQAKREWRDLGNQNANDLFMRKPQLAAAKANLESAKGALDIAELNLQRTLISVPFSGRVKQIRVDLGQFVAKGSPIATVYDATVAEVRLPLTERQASLVNLPFAHKNRLFGNALPQVILSGTIAGIQYQWQGELVRTDAFIDTQSRMYTAVVEVKNPFAPNNHSPERQAPLLPGLFVEAEIEGRELENIIELPRAALFKSDKLVTLDEESKAVIQQVSVVHRTDDRVWIDASLPQALSETTLVLIEKQSLAPAGAKVEPLIASENSGEVNAVAVVEQSNSKE